MHFYIGYQRLICLQVPSSLLGRPEGIVLQLQSVLEMDFAFNLARTRLFLQYHLGKLLIQFILFFRAWMVQSTGQDTFTRIGLNPVWPFHL